MSYSYNLNADKRRLLNMYISQYDQTSAHIERLTGMLGEIRDNIQQLIGEPQRQRQGQTSTPLNNRRFRSRESYDVFYDYSRPIDHSIYLDIPLTTQLTNRYTNTNANRNRNITSNTIISDLLNTFLNSTVPITPTQQQLTNASRTIRYSDIQGPLSESCPITLERFEPEQIVTQLLPCEHIFETNGFNNWFQNNVRCPVCRYDIREYRQTNNANTNTSNTNTNTSTNISTNQLLNELIGGFANSNTSDHLYFTPNYSYVLYETALPNQRQRQTRTQTQTQTQTQTEPFTNQENTTNNNA